jgi:carboxyl-terminal processing protease
MIKREKIEIESVKEARIISKGVAYIAIVNFQENTSEQVNLALKKLDQQGLQALIIDLRDNGGGLLEQAVDLAGIFLPKDKKVVSVTSKIKEQQKEHRTSGKYRLRKEPLVILVNQKSASASEIFSACLQDHKRATIIGTQTFGKASVQSVVPLDEKTAMKFTTARYLSPLGRMIDGIGIKPDEVIEKNESDKLDLQIVRALALLEERIKK